MKREWGFIICVLWFMSNLIFSTPELSEVTIRQEFKKYDIPNLLEKADIQRVSYEEDQVRVKFELYDFATLFEAIFSKPTGQEWQLDRFVWMEDEKEQRANPKDFIMSLEMKLEIYRDVVSYADLENPPSKELFNVPEDKSASKPVYIDSSITPPERIADKNPKSWYPKLHNLKRGGVMVVQCVITEKGTVSGVKLLRGIGLFEFDNALLEAAAKWRFKPAMKDGKPVTVYYTVSTRIH